MDTALPAPTPEQRAAWTTNTLLDRLRAEAELHTMRLQRTTDLIKVLEVNDMLNQILTAFVDKK